jgi:hypothetical protein
MSKEFVLSHKNRFSLQEANKQQKQILYFTKSNIQQDVSIEYLKGWSERNFITDDYFLNWNKLILRDENFLSVYKYMRYPLSSASLVNDEIKPALERVLYAEDSYFRYTVNGVMFDNLPDLKNDIHTKEFLDNILFRPNDVYITDLKDFNKSFCFRVKIEDIVSLEHDSYDITKIAFKSCINIDGEDVVGYAYIDDKEYIFYSSDFEYILRQSTHDLGECPAAFVAYEKMNDDFVIKKNIFSFVRSELEMYAHLKVLQRMTEINGAFPKTISLETSEDSKDGYQQDQQDKDQPLSAASIGGQQAEMKPSVTPTGSPTQAGSDIRIKIKEITDNEGKINMDIIKNFITNIHFPVDILKFINDRIEQTRQSIIDKIIGTHFDSSQEGSKSDSHLSKSYGSMEDRLRWVSSVLTVLRNKVDYDRLALAHGKDNITVDGFYGSKFFMEDKKTLLDQYERSPNPIERKNLVVKMTRNDNKFNKRKGERDVLLYDLLPYSSDKDFEQAKLVDGMMDETTFKLQTRFSYWIQMFEAEFGDLLLFFEGLGDWSKSRRIDYINKILISKITEDEQSRNSSKLVTTKANSPS